ncbi:hypothetical protein QU481_16820 [Crenobacter sp. SG2303]|uniref:Uncharacterized protein n=1 Tax=Crenobacter oryzisoli TaxID=3056844 RepID=A0ABT7XRV3_9NEIS|nr:MULTISPECIES: hypothetical protein [unclassified Crenobacter]MDN0076531.1 hypothetical protein [Crenobacter sp. SG2303]MDN0084909.1 hypothetical protein [Crenobacter sp. SG2305]
MKILCFFILLWLLALVRPVFAKGCLPEAISCSSPIESTGSQRLAGSEKESTLFQAGSFSLESIDSGDGSRLGLRPSFKLGESGKLTFRAGKKKELRASWTFN